MFKRSVNIAEKTKHFSSSRRAGGAATLTVDDSDGADMNSDDSGNVIDDALVGLNWGRKAYLR